MIRTLAGYIKEYTRDSLITPVFMIAEVILDMIIPFLMASIIDNGIEKGDMGHILRIGGLMLLMAVLGLITGMLGGALSARASAGLAKNLRKAMFRNIQTFSFSNIDKFSTPAL